MAPNVSVHFWAANDINGSTILELTDEDDFFKGFRYQPELFGLGGWELTLARKVGFSLFDSGAVQPEVFVRFLIHAWSDTDYYGGGLLQKRDQVVVHRDEQGAEEFIFGGPGPKSYMDRYRLGIEQLTGTGWNLDLENGVWRWNETATAGRVLNRIIAEDAAATDPSLPDLTKTFGDANDSDSNPWTNDVAGAGEYEIPIGQSLLTTVFDLEDLSDLYTVVNLGTVATPLYQLEAFEDYGTDVGSGTFGVGVGLLREGVNIADDSLKVVGVGLRKATHVIVEGKDGAWATAVGTAWSSGEYIKWEKIEYSRSSNVNILERAGLRWIRRQDNGDKQITVELVPGASEATGYYFPGPGEVLWPGNTITLDTAEDGSTHTPLDYNNEDQLLTGIELVLGPAGDTATADAKAKSWTIKVKLNGERGGFSGHPDQTSSATGNNHCKCHPLATDTPCYALDPSSLPTVTTTNGNVEAGAAGWSGGGVVTSPAPHAGTNSYGLATGASPWDFTYAFTAAQVFSVGVRYVIEWWTNHGQVSGSENFRFGKEGVDDETATNAELVADGLLIVDAADGAWHKWRMCWTPSADRTGVTFEWSGTQSGAGTDYALLDDVQAYSAGTSVGDGSSSSPVTHSHIHNDLSGRAEPATHPADAVTFTPAGTIAATDVQAAIEEVAAEATGSTNYLDWFIVTDPVYGAVGDDTTDDTAAIQAAIDAAKDVGGVVYFPAGTYKISSALSVQPTAASGAVTLRGNPPSNPTDLTRGSIIRQATANTNAVTAGTNCYDLYVQDLKLHSAAGFSSGAAIHAQRNVHTRDVWINGFFNGIHLAGSGGAQSYYSKHYRLMVLDAEGSGFLADDGVNNVEFSACRFSSNTVNGIKITGCAKVGIFGGSVEGNGSYGIDINGGSNATGGVVISGVYFESTGTADIRLGSSAMVRGSVIEGCVFINGPSFNIDVLNVDGLVISGNDLRDVGTTIRTQSPAAGVVLIGNRTVGTYSLSGNARILDPETDVTPSSTAGANSAGTSRYFSRADHVHEGAVTAEAVSSVGRWEPVTDGVNVFVWDGDNIVVQFVETP